MLYKGPDTPDLRGENRLKAVSYYYHFNHHTETHFAIGGFFGFCNVSDGLNYPERYEYTDVKGTSMFLIPSVKWLWLNNSWCSFYVKASAGFHYQSLYLDSETIPSEQTDEYKRKHLGFAYYVTPFGWEIGRQKVRWFMEIGLGSNTNFQTGLTYRFGRY